MNKRAVILICAVLLAALVVMCAVAFTRAVRQAQIERCRGNLMMIASNREAAAREINVTNGAVVPFQMVVQYMKGNRLPTCPDGGQYEIHEVGRNPTCSLHGDLMSR